MVVDIAMQNREEADKRDSKVSPLVLCCHCHHQQRAPKFLLLRSSSVMMIRNVRHIEINEGIFDKQKTNITTQAMNGLKQ